MSDEEIIAMFDEMEAAHPGLSTEKVMELTVEKCGIDYKRFCQAIARQLDLEAEDY